MPNVEAYIQKQIDLASPPPAKDARRDFKDAERSYSSISHVTTGLRASLGELLLTRGSAASVRIGQAIAPDRAKYIAMRIQHGILEKAHLAESHGNFVRRYNGNGHSNGFLSSNGYHPTETAEGSTGTLHEESQTIFTQDCSTSSDIATSLPIYPEIQTNPEQSEEQRLRDHSKRMWERHFLQQRNGHRPEDKKEEKPFEFFDEEGERKVDILKEAVNKKGIRKIYVHEHQTNESLRDYAKKFAGRNIQQLDDIQQILKYLIENPFGLGTQFLNDFIIKTQTATFRLRRLNPGKIPGIRFRDPNSNSLRVIFFYDKNANAVTFKDDIIITHKEMERKYGGRN